MKKSQDFLMRPLVLRVSRDGKFDDGTLDNDFDKVKHIVEGFYQFMESIHRP